MVGLFSNSILCVVADALCVDDRTIIRRLFKFLSWDVDTSLYI